MRDKEVRGCVEFIDESEDGYCCAEGIETRVQEKGITREMKKERGGCSSKGVKAKRKKQSGRKEFKEDIVQEFLDIEVDKRREDGGRRSEQERKQS